MCGVSGGHLLAETVVRIPPGVWMSVANVAFCQVDSGVSDRSLVQRICTEFGVFECGREAFSLRRARPTGDCCAMGKGLAVLEASLG